MVERAAGFVLAHSELFVCILVMCKEHQGVLSARGRQRAPFSGLFPYEWCFLYVLCWLVGIRMVVNLVTRKWLGLSEQDCS